MVHDTEDEIMKWELETSVRSIWVPFGKHICVTGEMEIKGKDASEHMYWM